MGPVLVCEQLVHSNEPRRKIGFRHTGVDPKIAGLIIDQGAEVPALPQGCDFHRTANVGVNSTKAGGGNLVSGLKWGTHHLPLNACDAIKIFHVVGGITVQYPARLYSVATVPTAIPRSLFLIQYYFGL